MMWEEELVYHGLKDSNAGRVLILGWRDMIAAGAQAAASDDDDRFPERLALFMAIFLLQCLFLLFQLRSLSGHRQNNLTMSKHDGFPAYCKVCSFCPSLSSPPTHHHLAHGSIDINEETDICTTWSEKHNDRIIPSEHTHLVKGWLLWVTYVS